MKIYTGGTFDLFHAGHVNFLKQCRKLAGKDGEVCVALNKDEFIEKYKGKPPIMNDDERREVLEACRYVDRVIWNEGGADSTFTIEKTYRGYNPVQWVDPARKDYPDIIVIGDDWAKRDYYSQMGFTQEWLDEREILLAYIPYTQGISSTQIKERL